MQLIDKARKLPGSGTAIMLEKSNLVQKRYHLQSELTLSSSSSWSGSMALDDVRMMAPYPNRRGEYTLVPT